MNIILLGPDDEIKFIFKDKKHLKIHFFSVHLGLLSPL